MVDPRDPSIKDMCSVPTSSLLDPGAVNYNNNSSIANTGELLSHISCDFSLMMLEFTDLFQCENWRPLYEAGMYDALCYSGVSGLMWVTITQSIVVIMSLVMLTFWVGYFDLIDLSPHATAGNEGTIQQDITMITADEDEDDEDQGNVRSVQLDSSTQYYENEQRKWGDWEGEGNFSFDDWEEQKSYKIIGLDTDTAQIMEAEINPMASLQKHQGPLSRLPPQTQLRESKIRRGYSNVDHTGRIHRMGDNTNTSIDPLTTSSMYAVRAPSFASNKDSNVEVSIHHNRRQHTHSNDGDRYSGTPYSGGGGGHDHYPEYEGSWNSRVADLVVSPKNVSKDISEEAIRIRERLQEIKERRAKLAKR